MLAYLLDKLHMTKEVDGTSMLDNMVMVAGGGLSDANNHVHNDVPVAIFGGAQGKLRGGRHIVQKGAPLSNVHLSVIEMFGAPTEEYVSNETSDATGVMKDLV
jgi:hypothetical protein